MILELRKLLWNRRVIALMLVVFLVNGVMFYQHCTDDSKGVTMSQIQSQYQRGIDLEEREQTLLGMIRNSALSNVEIQEAVLEEYAQVHAAVERIQEAQNYEDVRVGLVNQAKMKIMLGLFGDEDSFEVRSLKRGIEDYQALEGTVAEVDFFGSVELLAEWHLSDVFVFLLAMLPVLMLFVYERELGIQMLTQPTKYGRWRLYTQKYVSGLVLTLGAAVLLFGMNYWIVRRMFGPIAFDAPLQSVYGYTVCQFKITVGEFLACLLGQKLLWSAACMSIMVVISAGMGNVALVIGGIAVSVGLALGMGQSNVLWIRWISLAQLAAGEKLFQGATYLNLFGIPVERLTICLNVLWIFAAVGFFAGSLAYCRGSVMSGRKGTWSWHRLLHTNLMLQEMEKSLFLWRGAMLLLVLAGLQWGLYHDIPTYRGEDELYYQNYSQTLSGLPSVEKEQFLLSQISHFEDLENELRIIEQKYDSSSVEYQTAAVLISNQLRPQAAFQRARNQYCALSSGQSYLYETPYEILLGAQRNQADAANYAIAFLFLTLLFSGFFAGEQETGMAVLQTAAGRNKSVFRRKIVLLLAYSWLIAMLSFVPRMWGVFAAFGGLDISAQANSVTWWQGIPDGVTVGLAFALQLLNNYLICLGAGGIICFLSAKIGNTTLTMAVALTCLLIPIGIAYF